jgi:hypothetical protein
MAAYGGTLLNTDFRRHWWPVALAHVALNLGLLIMERAVTPQRRKVRGDSAKAVRSGRKLRIGDSFMTAAAALVAGFVAWDLESPHYLLDATAWASISIYALALFHRYTMAPAAPFERQEVQAHKTVLETIE